MPNFSFLGLHLHLAHARAVFLFGTEKCKKYFFRTYPCGVLIQRIWSGKLALWTQNLIWTSLSREKSQKPLNFDIFQNTSNLGGFWDFSLDREVQIKFWLDSANLPDHIVWINTPHGYVLKKYFLYFSVPNRKTVRACARCKWRPRKLKFGTDTYILY